MVALSSCLGVQRKPRALSTSAARREGHEGQRRKEGQEQGGEETRWERRGDRSRGETSRRKRLCVPGIVTGRTHLEFECYVLPEGAAGKMSCSLWTGAMRSLVRNSCQEEETDDSLEVAEQNSPI